VVKQSASRCDAVYISAGRILYIGACTKSCPITMFLSFGQMDRFGVETLVHLSGYIVTVLLPHICIVLEPRYRKLQVKREQKWKFFLSDLLRVPKEHSLLEVLIESIPLCSKLSVYLYKPLNTKSPQSKTASNWDTAQREPSYNNNLI
jgi:hypothetical protein